MHQALDLCPRLGTILAYSLCHGIKNFVLFLACLHEQCVIMQTMLYLAGVPEVCLDQPTPPRPVSRRSQDGGRSCPHVLQHVQWQ